MPVPVASAPLAPVADDDTLPSPRHPPLSHEREQASSPVPSDHGSMRPNSHGSSYVGSFHWAAVLDSISDLRDHYQEEEEARLLADNGQVLHRSPGPRILYEPVQTTKPNILAAIPARPAVDRMVARYFNAQGVVPEILHSDKFLREVWMTHPNFFGTTAN